MIKHLTIATPGQGLHEFTDKLNALVRDAGVREGLCTLFVQHTSASLLIQENADPDVKADLLAHLGRSFVTSVTLQAGANYRLRCQSFTDVPWQELFAPPGAPGRTFERFVEESGRVEAIWFPFTQTPWLKIWSVCPEKPPTAREVHGPYNYFFSDSIPDLPLLEAVGEPVAVNPDRRLRAVARRRGWTILRWS